MVTRKEDSMMKTRLSLLLCAILALTACSNDDNDVTQNPEAPTTEAPQTIKFNLTASHPDDDAAAQTRAVKQTWEAGDAIFVFFTGAEAPKHLKMTYDGTTWTSAEYDGATPTVGALGLKNGDTGTMRAVFLPFGSDATVSASGTSFTFSTTYYAYYATATLSYTVNDNEVSGTFDMVIPADYVQFFVEDAAATNGGYTLGTDAVIPTGVASIAADGTITETSNKAAGDDMTGYAYSGGYLFSGKLNGSYSYGGYYFAKTKSADKTRADYFVSGKTLASHSAVKLPANDNVYTSTDTSTGKWIPVGSGITVTLYKIQDAGTAWELTIPLGKWYTCNYGESVPEALGSLYSFDDANALDVSLPTKTQFQMLANSSNYTWLTVHGQQGAVFKAARGFLFLPGRHSVDNGLYWSSTTDDDDSAWQFFFNNKTEGQMNSGPCTYGCTVRPIQN